MLKHKYKWTQKNMKKIYERFGIFWYIIQLKLLFVEEFIANLKSSICFFAFKCTLIYNKDLWV